MFLTRMQINPRRRGAKPLLTSPQAMHAAVCAGFADPAPTAAGRVLWRLDTHSGHRVLLHILSPGKPDLTHLVEQAGWPTTEAWETRPYDRLLEQLRPGQHWQFRLTANPVHSARRAEWSDTKPLGHVTVQQQMRWLLDRAEPRGFRIPPSTSDPDEHQLVVVDRAVRRFDRGGKQVTIATATFEGMLEITDVGEFGRCLTHGLGRAKSYGCGLVTLAYPSAAER